MAKYYLKQMALQHNKKGSQNQSRERKENLANYVKKMVTAKRTVF